MPEKKLLLVAGPSGSGKTFYSRALEKSIGAAYCSRDDLRNAYLKKHDLPDGLSYEEMFQEPNAQYDAWFKKEITGDNELVVVEHPFNNEERVNRYVKEGTDAGRSIEVVLFFAKPEELMERMLSRKYKTIDEMNDALANGEAEAFIRTKLKLQKQAGCNYAFFEEASVRDGVFNFKLIENTGFNRNLAAEFAGREHHIVDEEAYNRFRAFADIDATVAIHISVEENKKAKNGYDIKVEIDKLPPLLQQPQVEEQAAELGRT